MAYHKNSVSQIPSDADSGLQCLLMIAALHDIDASDSEWHDEVGREASKATSIWLAAHVAVPVLPFAQLWDDVQQIGVSMHRLGDIINTRMELLGHCTNVPCLEGRIEFEQVSFRYRPDAGCRRQWFLSNPSLHWTTRAIFLNARKLLIAF